MFSKMHIFLQLEYADKIEANQLFCEFGLAFSTYII
jgi:hypothetical protein